MFVLLGIERTRSYRVMSACPHRRSLPLFVPPFILSQVPRVFTNQARLCFVSTGASRPLNAPKVSI